ALTGVLTGVALPPSLGAQNQQNGASTHEAVPSVRAVAATDPIVLDGVLKEGTWSSPSVATDFRQQDPREGEPATQRTEVRFAYDAQALYVGARMYDSLGAAGVRTRLARRDENLVAGDGFMIVLDTYHDHSGRTQFWINPSGVKWDAGQATSFADPAWNAVWEVATRIDSLGWTAELRIPLSQLRFPPDSTLTWGVQLWRYVDRLNELSMWSFWGKTESGGPPRFGHLTDLRFSARPRGFEVLPYTVARASYVTPAQPGTPLQRPEEYEAGIGADVKMLLTPSLTLSATLNPDFGQVEQDPAEVNLTAFETFFQEKRPFFVEGSGVLNFGGLSCFNCSNANGMNLFYTRRIGRAPQGSLPPRIRYSEAPDNTSILGAAKVTGQIANGWQVGVLDAVTGSERAELVTADGQRLSREVEPLTNYFVARLQRNLSGGNGYFGFMATSVARRFAYDSLAQQLPARAEALGVDWIRAWRERTYELRGNFAVSQVSGDSLAVVRLQHASARYFQRPDRQHGSNGLFSDAYDPSLGVLRGHGGYLRLAKVGGDWRWEGQVNYRSPGFEVNDVAFLGPVDYVWLNGNVLRRWTRPTAYYRSLQVLLGGQRQYNFDGDGTDGQVHGTLNSQLLNYWSANLFGRFRPEASDDRATRGGPVVHRPREYYFSGTLNTDARRAIVVNANAFFGRDADDGWGNGFGLGVEVKPASNVSLTLNPSYRQNESIAQYVLRRTDPTATHFLGHRAVFATIFRRTLSMGTRLSWTFTPTLSLDGYVEPFVATGDYSAFKEFTATRTTRKRVFDAGQLSAVRDRAGRDSLYVLDADRDPATAALTFANPDFNVRSLRGTAVLRWEYRPGSTLFLVWQQNRGGTESFGDFELGRDVGGIFEAQPDNVFVVKVNYWLGR
ncbi:MAG TPA: DUF5916 domain-containing protein, partial [Longimicrobiaceae bacterium]|nr:DUF5916 domain-containing protein [Longimicrobiaceae bacterium]